MVDQDHGVETRWDKPRTCRLRFNRQNIVLIVNLIEVKIIRLLIKLELMNSLTTKEPVEV